jgi:hypothetical protein
VFLIILWGGIGGERKICWVMWEEFCLPKCRGELGVKDLRKFNKSLLVK